MRNLFPGAIAVLALAACTDGSSAPTPTASSRAPTTDAGASGRPFGIDPVATYDEPWAMTFLPGTSYLAITLRPGRLVLRDTDSGRDLTVDGVPPVVEAGQGGLGDIIPGPTYAEDETIFLSWAEAGPGDRSGAVVGRARLVIEGERARLDGLSVIWRQEPKVSGSGHFGHRLAVSPDGRYLFISSGERQKLDPAQDLDVNLGKIVRLLIDGRTAPGNPFAGRGGVADQIWSYGHRNPLGLAFDGDGNLWASEMGPQGGDEINLILPGKNYGWPKASNGSHYSGEDIPDHAPGDGYEAPKVWWNPSISPGSLMIYSGSLFPNWRGDAFVGALSGRALIRVDLDATSAAQGEEWDMGARIREVEQGLDGAIWVLEDGAGARLLRLTPQ